MLQVLTWWIKWLTHKLHWLGHWRKCCFVTDIEESGFYFIILCLFCAFLHETEKYVYFCIFAIMVCSSASGKICPLLLITPSFSYQLAHTELAGVPRLPIPLSQIPSTQSLYHEIRTQPPACKCVLHLSVTQGVSSVTRIVTLTTTFMDYLLRKVRAICGYR